MATFAEYAASPGRQRIVLLEVDLPLEQVQWNPYEAGIWQWQLTFPEDSIRGSYWHAVFGVDYQPDNEIFRSIKSLSVDNVSYVEAADLATLRATDKSFYYDPSTTILYVHFSNFDPARAAGAVYLGAVQGFCDQQKKGDLEGCYFNDIYYEPRIKGDLSLPLEKDPMEYGIFGYDSVAVELHNADGFCDNWPNINLFGQPMRLLVGFNGLDYADFEQVFTGVVETPEYPDFGTAIINGVDTRKALSRSIPIRQFSQDDYPYLSDNDHGKEKPIAWGAVRNCKCICLNKEQEGAGTYTYMFLDTTDHNAGALTTVYVDGSAVTPGSPSVAAGTFTLTTAECDGGKAEVTADFTGYSGITNGLDVIKDMLLTYEGVSYIAANYDTTEWATETAAALNIGLYVDQAAPMNELIEQICATLQGIFYVQGVGKYSFRSWDESRASSATISEDEYAADDWEITYPPEEYLSSVKILYDKDYAEGDYRAYTNQAHESDAIERHHTYEQGEIETLLLSEANALAISEAIMARRKYIRPTCSRRVLTYPNFNIMDFVTTTVKRNGDTDIISSAIYEVIGVDKLTGELTLKWVKSV